MQTIKQVSSPGFTNDKNLTSIPVVWYKLQGIFF